VVVAIILILTSAVGFVAVRWIASANRAAARTQIETYAVALAAYYADSGAYPTAEQGLPALWERPVLEPVPASWNGPYLARPVPRDPWSHEYEYRVPGPAGLPYGIRSLGADGKEGGDGQSADIQSWSD
jgi:general secretion pathway protein G